MDVSVDEGSFTTVIVVVFATNITLKHLNFNLKIVKQDILKRLILDLNLKNSTKIFDLTSSLSAIKNAIQKTRFLRENFEKVFTKVDIKIENFLKNFEIKIPNNSKIKIDPLKPNLKILDNNFHGKLYLNRVDSKIILFLLNDENTDTTKVAYLDLILFHNLKVENTSNRVRRTEIFKDI